MMNLFLDIEIGNREAYDRDLHAYRVTADYLRHVGYQVVLYLPRPAMLPPIAARYIETYVTYIACSTAYPLPFRA